MNGTIPPPHQKFAVIDTETTGLSPAYGHALCEIALAVCEGDRVIERYETLIHPGRSIPPAVSRIHGITDEMVRFSPRFFQIKDEILKRIQKAGALVFHNAPFDLGFLLPALEGCGETMPEDIPILDTVLLTRRLYPGISHSLPNLTERFGIDHAIQHRAMADVEAARLLFLKCAEEIAGKDWRLESLLEYQGRRVAPRLGGAGRMKIPEDFLAAIAEQRSVRILYRREGFDPEERLIDPYSVLYARDTAYIDAFCHLRTDLRRFRWDRILEYTVTEELFQNAE